MSKIRKTIHNLSSRFTVISDVYWSFIPKETISTKCCLTQWISQIPGSFEIHWVRQVPGKFHGPGSGGHSKTQLFTRRSQFSQVSGMANCPNIFITAILCWLIFTHQPFGLECYCRIAPRGRADSRANGWWGTHIWNRWADFLCSNF